MIKRFRINPDSDSLFWQVIAHVEQWLEEQGDGTKNINVIYYCPENEGFEQELMAQSDVSVEWDDVRVLPMATLEINEVGIDRVPPRELDVWALEYLDRYEQEQEDKDDVPPTPGAGKSTGRNRVVIVPTSPDVSAATAIEAKLYYVGGITIEAVKEALDKFRVKYCKEPTFMKVPGSTPEPTISRMGDELRIDIATGAQDGHVLLI